MSQRKMGSPASNRVNRIGDDFRSLGYQMQRQIRRMLIRRMYNFHDWVTPHTYRHPELEGVEGVIEQVETDYPFYLVHFPSRGERYWFPEPELQRVRRGSADSYDQPQPGPGRAPGSGRSHGPGSGSGR